MKALLTTCAEIEHLADTPQVWRACVAALAKAGLPVAMHLSSDAARKDIRVLSTHPEIHKSQAAADDPFLEWCCSSYDITKTGVAFLDDYPYLAEDEKAFIRAAEAHGFRSGLAVPMRLESSGRFGGFNLGTGLDRAAFLDQIFPHFEAIRFFCLVVHRRLEEVEAHPQDAAMGDQFRQRLLAPASQRLSGLSPREREVIYLQAQGLPRKEVARLCGISPHTVAEYTTKAYRKLGINNRTEAARLVFDR